MKATPPHTGKTLKALGLVLSLGALPILLGVTSCTTSNRYEQSSSDRNDDRADSSRVRRALSEDTQYKYGDVAVHTYKGVVELTGFVNSRDQKNRAGELARKVEGVRDVENNIIVKESAN